MTLPEKINNINWFDLPNKLKSLFKDFYTSVSNGIQTITGDGVGGTSTDVVITFPTPAEIGAQEKLTAGENINIIGNTINAEVINYDADILELQTNKTDKGGYEGTAQDLKDLLTGDEFFVPSNFDFSGSLSSYQNKNWVITTPHTLTGVSFEIPVGVTLDFRGGSFLNGTITGNNTIIKDTINKIFSTGTTFAGTWNIDFSRPEWFGKSDTDDNPFIVSAISMIGSGEVRFSKATYNITAQIDVPYSVDIIGSGVNATIINILATDEVNIFNIEGDSHPDTSGTRIESMTFIDSRASASKSYGYAIYCDGVLNLDARNLKFRSLGGGAIKTTGSSNNSLTQVYAFGCGGRTEFRDPNNGIIQVDRTIGFANTLNLNDVYVSNCHYCTGALISTHVVRLKNVSIETCHTLLRLGTIGEAVSRRITVDGLYLENAINTGISIQNVIGATFVNTYFNDNNGSNPYSLEFINAREILFTNCELGTQPINLTPPFRNIKFDNCTGVTIPEGYAGFNDALVVKDNQFRNIGIGEANNLLPDSDDLSGWSGSASRTEQSNFFGDKSWLIEKTTASHDVYITKTLSFPTGSKNCFSFWLNGYASAKIRARKVSDSSYVDAKVVEFPETSGWKRVYISLEPAEDYNQFQLRITPFNFSTANKNCQIANLQFQNNSLTPGAYIRTISLTDNIGSIALNKPYYQNGKYISFGTAAPITGTYNVGDKVINTSPSAGGYEGWVCITAGTSGTWKGYGLIEV